MFYNYLTILQFYNKFNYYCVIWATWKQAFAGGIDDLFETPSVECIGNFFVAPYRFNDAITKENNTIIIN